MNPKSSPIEPNHSSTSNDTSSLNGYAGNYSAGIIVKPPSKTKLTYDIVIFGLILIDLAFIGFDLIITSEFIHIIAEYFGVDGFVNTYISNRPRIKLIGGAFTIFLIVELHLRWALAIAQKKYLRWFFFPFIHWYEVLGCFPQLRVLRLLRAVVIGRRLYQLDYRFLPDSWLASGKFYYGLIMEEIADRVILTATDNLRQQFLDEKNNSHLIQQTLDNNRVAIQSMVASMLRQELMPHIQDLSNNTLTEDLSHIVGQSIQEALANTPELSRYLRLIPIAGSLIEGQLQNIGQQVGRNLVTVLIERLLQPTYINGIIDTIAASVAHIEIDNEELDTLIGEIVNDGLTAFEQQVKIQQWKHNEHLTL